MNFEINKMFYTFIGLSVKNIWCQRSTESGISVRSNSGQNDSEAFDNPRYHHITIYFDFHSYGKRKCRIHEYIF